MRLKKRRKAREDGVCACENPNKAGKVKSATDLTEEMLIGKDELEEETEGEGDGNGDEGGEREGNFEFESAGVTAADLMGKDFFSGLTFRDNGREGGTTTRD